MSKKLGRRKKEKLLNKKPRESVCKCYIYNDYGDIRWFSKSDMTDEMGFYSNISVDAEYVSFGRIEKLKKQYPDLEIFST